MSSSFPDWARGDALGIDLPADASALGDGGAAWLTRAFRASGALAAGAAVAAITRLDEWNIGGTGAKAFLSVDYGGTAPDLPTELFVKFSRNFTDPFRDNARHHMEGEVRLAALSREPAFPVAVPLCLYADFERASGTGVLITERIAYGRGPIEPHHLKCMDHLLPDALGHYRTLMTALARLAGAHKSGRLGQEVDRHFPLDVAKLIASDRNPYDRGRLTRRVERLADFVAAHPQLFPAKVTDPAFLARLIAEAPGFLDREDAIRADLHARADHIALCHWNANIDNGWFWRHDDGTLRCGLIDWGSVGQMPLAMTLWGCLSGAEPELWDDHLDELIALFAAEYAASGGPRIDTAALTRELELKVMTMGLAWLVDAPARIRLEIPEPSVLTGPHDPLLAKHEQARVQLRMVANVLNLWAARDLGRHLR